MPLESDPYTLGISFMYPLRCRLLIFCLWSIFAGCGTNTSGHETLMEEGFPISRPGLETLTVVWGNHSGAVNQAIHWLNDHQFLVVDRWMETELYELDLGSQAQMKQQAHMLSVAHRVGAPLVVFVQVNKKPFDQKFRSMSLDGHTSQIIGVEIRGMNAETADIVFGAKVWNSEPQVASEQLVQDLTTFALHKALKEPRPPFPLQQKVRQVEKKREQVTVHSPPRHEEIADVPPGFPSVEDHSTAISKKSAVSSHLESEKKAGRDITAPAMSTDENISDAEPQTSQSSGQQEGASSKDSSIGLQIASGALSLVYTPFKCAYAVIGGFFGSLAYAVTAGNEEVAQSVWNASWGGDFWLTPDHLRGDLPIDFIGQTNKGEVSYLGPAHNPQ